MPLLKPSVCAVLTKSLPDEVPERAAVNVIVPAFSFTAVDEVEIKYVVVIDSPQPANLG